MMTCSVCNRPLTDPVSIARGMGPDCAARLAMTDDDASTYDVLITPWIGTEGAGLIVQRLPDGRAATNVPRRHVHHSPTGFAWGYGGSGPADLALNALAALLPLDLGSVPVTLSDGSTIDAHAWHLHQAFKAAFVAPLPAAGGSVPLAALQQWLIEHPGRSS